MEFSQQMSLNYLYQHNCYFRWVYDAEHDSLDDFFRVMHQRYDHTVEPGHSGGGNFVPL